eukprot:486115-Prymnesium_polylepis.1
MREGKICARRSHRVARAGPKCISSLLSHKADISAERGLGSKECAEGLRARVQRRRAMHGVLLH